MADMQANPWFGAPNVQTPVPMATPQVQMPSFGGQSPQMGPSTGNPFDFRRSGIIGGAYRALFGPGPQELARVHEQGVAGNKSAASARLMQKMAPLIQQGLPPNKVLTHLMQDPDFIDAFTKAGSAQEVSQMVMGLATGANPPPQQVNLGPGHVGFNRDPNSGAMTPNAAVPRAPTDAEARAAATRDFLKGQPGQGAAGAPIGPDAATAAGAVPTISEFISNTIGQVNPGAIDENVLRNRVKLGVLQENVVDYFRRTGRTALQEQTRILEIPRFKGMLTSPTRALVAMEEIRVAVEDQTEQDLQIIANPATPEKLYNEAFERVNQGRHILSRLGSKEQLQEALNKARTTNPAAGARSAADQATRPHVEILKDPLVRQILDMRKKGASVPEELRKQLTPEQAAALLQELKDASGATKNPPKYKGPARLPGRTGAEIGPQIPGQSRGNPMGQ